MTTYSVGQIHRITNVSIQPRINSSDFSILFEANLREYNYEVNFLIVTYEFKLSTNSFNLVFSQEWMSCASDGHVFVTI